MAEFCLECWNRIMGTTDPPKKFILSKELDFCEECCEWKPVIIRVKRRYLIAEWCRETADRLREYRK